MISIAWRPIEPVAPRRATRFTCSVYERKSVEAERADDEIRGRSCEEERVDAVEDAAVAAEEPSRVLHVEIALEGRLEEVADDRSCDDHDPEYDGLPPKGSGAVCRRAPRR